MGAVYSYKSKEKIGDKHPIIVLKITDDHNEARIVKKLDGICSLLKAKNLGEKTLTNSDVTKLKKAYHSFKYIYAGDSIYYILLQFMDGDLSSIRSDIQELSLSDKLRITVEIGKRFQCLKEKGFGYLDLKMENVLYICVKKKLADFALGDLGSIGTWGEEVATTYPIINAPNRKGGFIVIDDKSEIWALSIFLLEMLAKKPETIVRFNFSRKITNEKVEKIWRKVFNESKELLKFMMSTLTKIIEGKNTKLETWVKGLERLEQSLRENSVAPSLVQSGSKKTIEKKSDENCLAKTVEQIKEELRKRELKKGWSKFRKAELCKLYDGKENRKKSIRGKNKSIHKSLTRKDCETLTVAYLKELLRKRKEKGYSQLRKSELCKRISKL